MACSLGSRSCGDFSHPGSYHSPYSRSRESYYSYQDPSYSAFTTQQRYPYTQLFGGQNPSYGSMGGSAFSNFEQSSPCMRSGGYQYSGVGMGSSPRYGGRSFNFSSRSPFAGRSSLGLRSPFSSCTGTYSTSGQRLYSRSAHYRRGPPDLRGPYATSRPFDLDDDSDDEDDYSPYRPFGSRRGGRGGSFVNRLGEHYMHTLNDGHRPSRGSQFIPRYSAGYGYGYDGYSEDDDDDEDDDYSYVSYPNHGRRQRY